MTRMELAKHMKENSISDKAISFIPCNEKYCLVKTDDSWVIFYDERRERTFEQAFPNESAACAKLLELALANQ